MNAKEIAQKLNAALDEAVESVLALYRSNKTITIAYISVSLYKALECKRLSARANELFQDMLAKSKIVFTVSHGGLYALDIDLHKVAFTVSQAKTFSEIYKQHQGENHGSQVNGRPHAPRSD